MINKQNLWFVTLFALILILGIYYVSMPNDSITVFSDIAVQGLNESENTIKVEESDLIIAMKVEQEEEILKEMEEAQNVLLDETSSVQDKNEAYEILQLLNSKKGKTEEIEKMIQKEYNFNSCVVVDNEKISITIDEANPGKDVASKIIASVQNLYDKEMYITIKFK